MPSIRVLEDALQGRKRDRTQIRRLKDDLAMQPYVFVGLALAGLAQGALVDAVFGAPDKAATWGDTPIPVNLSTAGPLFVVALLWDKMPGRAFILSDTFGQTMVGLYRLFVDNVDLSQAAAAPARPPAS